MAAVELKALIQTKIDELNGENQVISQKSAEETQAEAGEWLKIDGTLVPFEMASFGIQTADVSAEMLVVPFPVRIKTSSSPVKGNVAVLQYRGRMDAAWVDDLLDAQSSGAAAALIVNFTGNQLVVPGELTTSVPVLVLPLYVLYLHVSTRSMLHFWNFSALRLLVLVTMQDGWD